MWAVVPYNHNIAYLNRKDNVFCNQPEISLLALYIYKIHLFLLLPVFFCPCEINTHKLPLSHLLRISGFLILISRFLILSSLYPLPPYRTFFTSSVCRSSQKIRLTLFLLIPLFINPCILRYRYISLILKPMISRFHITSVAPWQ